MDTMPETTPFLVLGLAVTFGILGAFIVTMITRWRMLTHDLRTLEQIERDESYW